MFIDCPKIGWLASSLIGECSDGRRIFKTFAPTLLKTSSSQTQVVERWEGKSMLVHTSSIIWEVWSATWQSVVQCGSQPGRGHFVCQLLFYGCRGVCRAGPARWVGSNHGLKIVYGCLVGEICSSSLFAQEFRSRGVQCTVQCGLQNGGWQQKGGGSGWVEPSALLKKITSPSLLSKFAHHLLLLHKSGPDLERCSMSRLMGRGKAELDTSCPNICI